MRSSASQGPTLSIVIASRDAEKTIEACLNSLRDQETDEDYEILVVDSSTDGTAQLVERRFPEVKLYHFGERKYCGDARNIGISGARSEIIALTDADCEAPRTWVDDVLRAHRSPHLAIGGAIDNAEPTNLVGWAAYFCEFSNWMPRSQPRDLDDIAGANMSYKRTAFVTYGPFIEGTYCSDSEFHWRLGREGHRLRFLPHIVVFHRSIGDFGEFIAHEFQHGACFARVRTTAQGFSRPRRLGYVLLGPLLPFKVLLQVLTNNLRNRVHLHQLLRALPLVALGILSWSAGEVAGYAGRQRMSSVPGSREVGQPET